MLLEQKSSLRKLYCLRVAPRSGPVHDLSPARAKRVHHPATRGDSGPEHRQVRADSFRKSRGRMRPPNRQARPTFRDGPDCPAPRTPIPRGDRASFHASACSRRRLPKTRILISLHHINARKVPTSWSSAPGHAGRKAAALARAWSLRTVLVTMNLDLVAQIVHPAIGASPRATWWPRIDALGGIMGRARDAPASSSACSTPAAAPPSGRRARKWIRRCTACACVRFWEKEPNLRIKQAEVAALTIENRRVTGVQLRDGRRHRGRRP